MWLAIEIEDFPNWFDWQQGAFELIQKNLLPIGGPSTDYTATAARTRARGIARSRARGLCQRF